MKYLKQIAIILAVSFLGEFLNWLLPLPIPGSIYGMVILFVALMAGVIKLSSVKNVGDFLIDILPLLASEQYLIYATDRYKRTGINVCLIQR